MSAADNDNGQNTLASIGLEDLMNIRITSASKKEQKLARVAAAVYVITHEDIRRSGATSIPQLLRMVPGLDVAQVASDKWAISARGFNGRFSRSLLVLVDGRSVYSSLWSGIYWDQLDTLLDNIDRIEVIRGPGASVWGANAVNGVINIITRNSAETTGTQVTAGSGSYEHAYVSIRNGGNIGDRGHYRVHVRDANRGELRGVAGGGAHDAWSMMSGGFRTDLHLSKDSDFTVQGDVFRGRGDQGWIAPMLTPPYTQMVGDTATRGGDIIATYTRRLGEDADIRAHVFFDTVHRHEGFASDSSRSVDFEVQNRFVVGRHEVVWGVGHRIDTEENGSNQYVRWTPAAITFNQTNLFAQDDIALLTDRLYLTLGTKIENARYSGWVAEPTARLMWIPSRKGSFWLASSRAIRTPSRYEHDLEINLFAGPAGPGLTMLAKAYGNPKLRPEELYAFEAGFRSEFTPRLSLDTAAFYNRYQHNIGFVDRGMSMTMDPIPLLLFTSQTDNVQKTKAIGAEAAITWQPFTRSKWNFGYSWINSRCYPESTAMVTAATGSCDGTPRSQVQVRHYLDLSKNLSFDTAFRAIGAMRVVSVVQAQYRVPRYYGVDARLGWRPRKNLEISLVGENLVGPHREYLAEAFVPGTLVPRSGHVQVTWSF